MKKYFHIILLLSLCSAVFSQDIKNLDGDGVLKGNSYFPLFSGAKWSWTLEMDGAKTDFTWEIKGLYSVTDVKNNLEGVAAFYVECKELDGSWYFIENEGFISFYEKIDTEYVITKFFPLNPKIGDKWTSNYRINTVSSVTDDFVKVDIESDDLSTVGYRLYRKNIGLFDLYELEKTDKEELMTKWTLKEYSSFDPNTIPKIDDSSSSETAIASVENLSDDSSIKIDEFDENDEFYSSDNSEVSVVADKDPIDEEAVSVEEPEVELLIETPEESYFIPNLKVDKNYIQIGSFAMLANAINFYLDKKTGIPGFKFCIFKDVDGLYKVLIETDAYDSTIIDSIRKKIEPKSFFKQRKVK
ncbi:MAG TPA: hypothetical protein PLG34_08060 [Spirochaetota bacterium]|jgi:hypothetical protein|nr:MAG: hypothetical protein BWX91_01734 [Spirochaetes bacterium ADurb.Bin133]HNZ26881.1 hypothetical protein [Spirochaetota bacterium]HPY87921.1 hypothetical protein [Spirochaetota bacterium]